MIGLDKFCALILLMFVYGCSLEDVFYCKGPSFEHSQIDLKPFIFDFGDEIELASKDIKAVVLNFKEFRGKREYEICFMKDESLFGFFSRSKDSSKCYKLLHFIYIKESVAVKFKKVRNLKLDIEKICWGVKSPAGNLDVLRKVYLQEIEERKVVLTCDESGSEKVPKFFDIENFKD